MASKNRRSGFVLSGDTATLVYVLVTILVVLALVGLAVTLSDRMLDPRPFKQAWAMDQCHEAVKEDMFPEGRKGDEVFAGWGYENEEFLPSGYWSQHGYLYSDTLWQDGDDKRMEISWSCLISPEGDITLGEGAMTAKGILLAQQCREKIAEENRKAGALSSESGGGGNLDQIGIVDFVRVDDWSAKYNGDMVVYDGGNTCTFDPKTWKLKTWEVAG